MRRARILLVLVFALVATSAVAQPGTGTFRVATTGTNSGTCGSVATPCQTIQQAIQLAVTGDQILLAGGNHVYNAAVANPCTTSLGAQAVVCVVNKELTIRGGFSTSNWVTPNPVTNPTLLDGQNSRRVVHVTQTAQNQPTASLTLRDVTVQNGRVVGASSGPDTATFAFGGGLLADAARVVLQGVTFNANTALGGSTSAVYGGSGAGGGAALRAAPAGTSLEDVTFTGNIAQGGTGPTRGGFAVGGGLFVYDSELSAARLTFTANQALGGDTPGVGTDVSGFQGDALGGGVAFQIGSNAVVRGITAVGNQAQGGDANTGSGTAAGGFGGAVYAEGSTTAGFATNVSIFDSVFDSNVALGGLARNGGLGAGGAVMTFDATVLVDRSVTTANVALGGDGNGGSAGPAGGGGFYLTRFFTGDTATVRHSVIAGNQTSEGSGAAVGGGGGAFFLQGIAATLEHLTIDGNRLGGAGLQGSALVALAGLAGATVDLRWSLVSNHQQPPGASAVHVQSGNTLTYATGLWHNNADDSNEGAGGSGTFFNSGAMTTAANLFYAAPGSPAFDYHLLDLSPAIDAATGSTAILDFEANPRSQPDIGADEFLFELLFADGFETGTTSAWN